MLWQNSIIFHNPLILLILFQCFFLRTVMFSAFITFSIASFHNLILFFFMLCGTSIFTSTVSFTPPFFTLYSKQCQWYFCEPAAISFHHIHMNGLPYKAFFLHKYHGHQLLYLFLCSQNGFHLNRKSIHFTVVLPEKCCSASQSL